MVIFNKINFLIKILFIILSAFYFVLICKTKSICGYSFAIVNGNSMYPTIYDGDFLIINQSADYKINDIVCFFDKENKKIVHRIMDFDDADILTKGDFNKSCDEPISKSQIIGKVVYKSTILGFVFKNLHIIIVCFIVFICFKLKNLDEYDKMYIWMK